MSRRSTHGGHLNCSFCGKSQREVRKLIAGPTVYICDECIRLCNDIIAEESQRQGEEAQPENLARPREIKAFLDDYVVGQERAKKVLSVAVYNHYKRIFSRVDQGGVEIAKSNILLLGPTGVGKTLLAQSLAKFLNVPFAMADATTLTEAGYVGEDVESVIQSLLATADNDVEKAAKGIVYIDEIDKVARKGEGPSVTRDVSGEGVQQGLLKLIEGTRANVTPRGAKKYSHQEYVAVDTTNILFIVGGSFNGLDQLISRRIGRKGIGFGAELIYKSEQRLGEILRHVKPVDMVQYGLIPEFVGRLPVIATLDDLSREDLITILTQPKNALSRQYKKLFDLEKVKLSFTRGALEAAADQAMKRKGGARSLRAILENVMLDIMYTVPYLPGIKECKVTREVVESGAEPILIIEEEKKVG
ncbi:MAG: ATP-dependent Clp protease ATP-binding subunit ClpX [Pseudomonadota bacterium]